MKEKAKKFVTQIEWSKLVMARNLKILPNLQRDFKTKYCYNFYVECYTFQNSNNLKKKKNNRITNFFHACWKKTKIEKRRRPIDKLFTMATGLALLQQSTRSFDLCIPGLDTYPLPLYLACSFT